MLSIIWTKWSESSSPSSARRRHRIAIRDTKYDDLLEKIKETYEPKILAKLESIRNVCKDAGLFVSDPISLCDDEYRWNLDVARPDDPDFKGSVGIDITIAEQREHEDENGWGINFAIQVVEYDGTILGGVTPMNYTPFVWVDARVEDAVMDRWLDIATLDMFPIHLLIMEGR